MFDPVIFSVVAPEGSGYNTPEQMVVVDQFLARMWGDDTFVYYDDKDLPKRMGDGSWRVQVNRRELVDAVKEVLTRRYLFEVQEVRE